MSKSSEGIKMKECEKLAERTEEWNAIYPFMEWLLGQNIELCKQDEKFRKEGILVYYAIGKRIEDLLYEYFGINTEKLERERRQILEEIRQK